MPYRLMEQWMRIIFYLFKGTSGPATSMNRALIQAIIWFFLKLFLSGTSHFHSDMI